LWARAASSRIARQSSNRIVIATKPRKRDEIDLLIFRHRRDERGQLLQNRIIAVAREDLDHPMSDGFDPGSGSVTASFTANSRAFMTTK
jgi:hypothetical protein